MDIKKIETELQGHLWYNQRFDGAPLFLSFVGETETMTDTRRPPGTEAEVRLCVFYDKKADWFLDEADISRGAGIVLSLAEKDTDISQKIISEWKNSEKEYTDYCQNFNQKNLSDYSDELLAKEFEAFRQIIVERFSSSPIIDHFALGTDRIIADKIRAECGPFANETEFTAAFSALTAPIHQSFINEAEISLLSIAAEIKLNPTVTVEEKITKLKKHEANFFWIRNNFIRGEPSTANNFLTELEVILESNIDPMILKEKILSIPLHNFAVKNQALKKYNLSPLLRTLLQISEDFTKWQDERKRDTFWFTYIGTQFIQEMAKRRLVPMVLLKYLLASELTEWFIEDTISITQLQARREYSLAVWKNNECIIISGQEAKNLYQILVPPNQHEATDDIRGLVANTGKAIGQARILHSADEVGKINSGDILIAVMTRPDYVAGMKKAGAIVTDEGGITSHAAIVSRELGVPCIIGTKIATKIFKDGDWLEVNANHGVVRKINVDKG